MTLHIENAKPGHLALVVRLIALAQAEQRDWRKPGHDRAASDLDHAKRDLLALLRAQEEALESAAEREKGRAALRMTLEWAAQRASAIRRATVLKKWNREQIDRSWVAWDAELAAALKAHP